MVAHRVEKLKVRFAYMILLPHMLVGAVLGAKIHSYFIILPVALALHFFLDCLPHWEYEKKKLSRLFGAKFQLFIFKALLDLALGLAAVWWLFGGSLYLKYVIFSVFISILPDGLTLINRLSHGRIKFLDKLQLFHEKIHPRDNRKLVVGGLVLEALAVGFVIYIVVYAKNF